MLKAITLLFVAGGVLYFLFYPFVKNKVNRKEVFRWFIGLYAAALLFSTVGYYLSGEEEPESFREGVALIKRQRDIRAQIGQFKALRYNEDDLPQKGENPAILRFTLQGNKGTVWVKGKVAKDSGGDWYIIEIIQDSLLQNP